ncbi:Flp pilus assembly protein CpaB [Phenylobacterium montanum]|uniref:Flp pilus assembly protein CpaB n=1 Tax=Phenylobacterium montanum TaxID=2823693 RepID=A0A975IUY6_9CAUL|nr:Flp pilus assembly protein CpaB [Caulobacter sp. S6]
MGASRIIIIAVSAVAAIGIALIVHNIAVRPAAPHQAMAAAPAAIKPMTQVLVAKRDLPIGTRLAGGDIGWQAWPADSLNAAFITDGRAAQAAPATTGDAIARKASYVANQAAAAVTGGPMEALYGAIVRVPLVANEPIVQSKLVRGGEGGYMAIVVQKGMRAISIPVTTATGAGGFILPGDHVDVLQSHQGEAPAGGGRAPFITSTLMRNVRVLAIDQASQAAKNAQSMIGTVATLEVASADVEVLARAKAQGEVILALRAYSDAAGSPTRGVEEESQGANGTVRVVRAGKTTDETVSQ